MIEEICEVVKIKKNSVFIKLSKSQKCEGCKACGFGKKNEIIMPAIANQTFNIGDKVIVKMPEKQINSAPLIMYLIPLVFLTIGLLVGRIVNELLMIVLALSFLVVGFIPVYFLDRLYRKNKRFMPVIIGKAENLATISTNENLF